MTTTDTHLDTLLAEANDILHVTPDNFWWNMRPLQVVAFAFPDYEIVDHHENANYNRPTTSTPRVLLRHRTNPNDWFLIYSNRVELLPGRMSTMGQFFRFKNNWEKNHFAVGTPADLITATGHRHHAGNRNPLTWWLRDTFAAQNPTITPTVAHDPLWALLTTADSNLSDHPHTDNNDTTTTATLTRAFPDHDLVALNQNTRYHTRALLQHKTEPDQWVYLDSYNKPLLATNPTPGTPVLRAGEDNGRPHTNVTLGTAKTLVAAARESYATWPTSTDLWWLLHHMSHTHPDLKIAKAYARELHGHLTILALKATDDDKVYTEIREFVGDTAA